MAVEDQPDSQWLTQHFAAEDLIMLPEDKHDARVLDKQVREWKREIGRLADLISAAQGTSVAVVMFTPRTEGYEDVAPIILVEDVLDVSSRGWPTGVAIDVLNPASEAAP